MDKFIESGHCTTRAHCSTCVTSERWRESMMRIFDWDGSCPIGLTEEDFPHARDKNESPCSSKHCRLGDINCDHYWSCRDICRITEKRITSLDGCPKYNKLEKEIANG